jgi:N-acetylmuramoyl-L-alanine amidase
MLRNIIQNSILVLLLFMALYSFGQKNSYSIKKIVIDAGHGGKDPGAVVGKTYEKDIALDVALRAGKMIKKLYPEIEVVYTRDNDVFIPLMDRAEIANKQKADLFMSIHVNICATEPTTGAETYILGQHRSLENLEVAKLENAVILLEDDYNSRYEGFDPNSSESYIMFELLQNEYLEQSRLFADRVQNHFVSHAKRKDRGVRQAGFLVLRKTAMPSVLIELGFLSNKGEKDFMEKEQGRILMAESLVKSFEDYKKRFDENKQPVTLPEKSTALSLPANNDSLIDASTLKGKWYGTQIMSVNSKLAPQAPDFKKQKPIYFIKENGLYKYFIGLSQRADEAHTVFQEKKTLFKGSFLVSFDDGIKKSYK